ncbi:high frequency lysogenization protein HflD [Aliidiomarina maris]|uniref:High frequency lysogenization protein HflD homolog n=1 Tax=Aliidiomarina maris TaxID=531312 RepID=A0A327X6U3_9GAMM|nr:high frequency lysogenization protein HflD [Aliidiomarina maris]MBA3988203.1 lysogenization regulator HflD [Idiomarina sp.]RAJ98906.1 high frequency lysogenization protein [Aliidiomarina maris]RUO25050.1 lysogenization regulator HflD [Aliidiomarina maris]
MSQVAVNLWHQRMLAFAGMCLASVCAQQLARRGQVTPHDASDVLFDSLLILDAAQTEDIYQPLSALVPGLKVLLRQLDAPGDKDVEQTRYVIGMLQLERRLAKQPQAMQRLGEAMNQIKRQRDEFNFTASDVIANMAGVYSDIISPLGPRIQIQGNPEHLRQTSVQNRIRAVLLAGIRSAVLWRQLGGKRRQVIFNRRQMLLATKELLHAIGQLPEPNESTDA